MTGEIAAQVARDAVHSPKFLWTKATFQGCTLRELAEWAGAERPADPDHAIQRTGDEFFFASGALGNLAGPAHQNLDVRGEVRIRCMPGPRASWQGAGCREAEAWDGAIHGRHAARGL
jgi:hypothetical protein